MTIVERYKFLKKLDIFSNGHRIKFLWVRFKKGFLTHKTPLPLFDCATGLCHVYTCIRFSFSFTRVQQFVGDCYLIYCLRVFEFLSTTIRTQYERVPRQWRNFRSHVRRIYRQLRIVFARFVLRIAVWKMGVLLRSQCKTRFLYTDIGYPRLESVFFRQQESALIRNIVDRFLSFSCTLKFTGA